MATRNHPCTKNASNYAGASSRSKPVGKRAPALFAVRHDKYSPLNIAQEKTQSNVPSQENAGQASGDRWHFPGVEASGDQSHEFPEASTFQNRPL